MKASLPNARCQPPREDFKPTHKIHALHPSFGTGPATVPVRQRRDGSFVTEAEDNVFRWVNGTLRDIDINTGEPYPAVEGMRIVLEVICDK